MLPETTSEVKVTVAVLLPVKSTHVPAYGPVKPAIPTLAAPKSKQKGAALATPAQLVSAAAAAAAKSLNPGSTRKNPHAFMVALLRRLHGVSPPASGPSTLCRKHIACPES